MANTVMDVYNFLIAQNLAGGSTGWALLRRKVMDDPVTDQLVVVNEDGGLAPELPVAAGLGSAPIVTKGVMITVRAGQNDGDASFTKANAILVALHGLRGVELVSGGGLYYSVRAMTGEPVWAGFDDRERPTHTVAFRLLQDAANL